MTPKKKTEKKPDAEDLWSAFMSRVDEQRAPTAPTAPTRHTATKPAPAVPHRKIKIPRKEDLTQDHPKEIFNDVLLQALAAAGYEAQTTPIDVRPFGGVRTNSYEVFKNRAGHRFAITLKIQNARGSADRKIPYEVIVLSEMIEADEVDGAYLLIAGAGWAPQLREAFTSGVLRKWLHYPDTLVIMELDDFLKRLERDRI